MGMIQDEKPRVPVGWRVGRQTAEPSVTLRREGAGFSGGAACVIALGVIACAATGCGPNNAEITSFVHDWEATVSAAEYRVVPPDAIVISSAQAAEIDGEAQVIRQDGKISLRLLGEVKVAGLTPQEIARKLESLLSKYYVDPKVSVRVDGSDSKRVFVFGQVNGGGAYPYTGRDTLLGVLAKAQPTYLAWKSQVKVIRPSHEDDKRFVMVVDVDKIMCEGKLDQNVLLQEGDIVYVPPTPLAWVGLRLQELLFPVSPVISGMVAPKAIENSANVYDNNNTTTVAAPVSSPIP